MRMRASALPNINFASSFASSVFPTPVGPRNINVPIGLLGLCNPTRLRCMAFVSFSMALSCAMTLLVSSARIPLSRVHSSCCIRCIGIPEIIDTTPAMSSSSTVWRLSVRLFSHSAFICARRPCISFSRSRRLAACSKSWFFTAAFLSLLTMLIIFSCSSISFGTTMFDMCLRAPASSIASMALSGKQRSVM